MGAGPKWSAAEETRLIEMTLAGCSIKTIAAALGRSIGATRVRRTYLRAIYKLPEVPIGRPPGSIAERSGATRTKPAPWRKAAAGQRTCLGCGKPFASDGAHNRQCGRCRGRAAQLTYSLAL